MLEHAWDHSCLLTLCPRGVCDSTHVRGATTSLRRSIAVLKLCEEESLRRLTVNLLCVINRNSRTNAVQTRYLVCVGCFGGKLSEPLCLFLNNTKPSIMAYKLKLSASE